MPFGASPIAGPDARERFVSESAGIPPLDGSLDASGVWRMTFESHGPAKGNFTQVAPGIVEGTVEMPSEYGDLRFLAGNLDGAEVSLSAFDGGYAYLVRAHVAATGAMEGFFVCCDGERDRFTAQRSGDFDVVDPLQQVRVTSASRRVDFEPLLDPKYTGKAAILEIFGTWCPNCNDLAPLLTELYRSHHDEGLEMLGVAYEVSDSEEANQLRLDAYRAKHGLEWEVVIADTATEDLFASSPVSLSPIEGVPVTIFLNRDRTIHAIYAGFRGPATGAAHQETVERFRSLTREILDSPDPAS